MKLNRLILILGIGCILTGCNKNEGVEHPNLIVFLVDDMGVMDTSVPFLTDSLGHSVRHPLNDFFRTPNMEDLATRGTRFSSFYAMSVCSPTRISMMTGMNPARHHSTTWIAPFNNNRGDFGPPEWNWEGISEAEATLPGILAAAGYRTIHVGKAHFGPKGVPGADPQKIGFDVNIAGNYIGHPGSYYGIDSFTNRPDNPLHLRAVPDLEAYHGQDINLTDALTLEAIKELDKAVDAGQPFFLSLAHYAVHAPFMPHMEFISNYDESGKQESVRSFASMIESMDSSLGKVLAHLDEKGIAENTLVLFLGDNGSDMPGSDHDSIESAEPLRGKKGTRWEGGIRVPFIAAWARPDSAEMTQTRFPILKGAVETDLGNICDIYPTLLQAAGIFKSAADGISLAPYLRGEEGTHRPQEFLMHFPHQHRNSYFTLFIRNEWKVIYHYLDQEYELYDLDSDPTESENLATSNPERLRLMAAAMMEALEAGGALYPVKNGAELVPALP
jgi:arylsulfatase A-like enzyme